MKYRIRFSPKADKVIKKWKRSAPKLYTKLFEVVENIAQSPRSGIGRPEALVGGGDVIYSRRISAHDRIVYKIYDDEVLVLVLQVGGHYSDK